MISRKAQLAAIGAAVVIAGAAIYVTGGGQGNGGDAAACDATAARAAALDGLVGGEIAALQLAREPADLSRLAFAGIEDEPKTLGDFAGKIALVNLWATWCGPCRKEMPALDRLQAAMGGPDFEVVPVSIDTGEPQRPAEFLKSVGVRNLPLYTDRSTEIFQELKRRGLALGLPVTLLLDRNGCNLGHMNGPAEWDSEDGRRLIQAAVERSRPES